MLLLEVMHTKKSELYDGVKQACEDIKELKLNKGVIINKQFKSI